MASCALISLAAGCAAHVPGGAGLPSHPQAARGHAQPPAISTTRKLIEAASASAIRHAAASQSNGPDPVTADMPVARPNETPCTVQLFSNYAFTNYAPQPFSYAPPAGCPGPWAKVVLDFDLNVSAGRQFDRDASLWIGSTNIYFGSTAEPSAAESPAWHIERDITDLTPLLYAASSGAADVFNVVNSTYTGVIHGSAKLDFYPATVSHPAAAVPDAVYGLSAGAQGGNVRLPSSATALSGTFTFPQNTERVYLDAYLQGQSNDEFWYTCFPNDLAQQLNNCANTAFREGEVSVDGMAAGVVPVYPWIFTGGIDPYLWRPIPGVETLQFAPYRIDLTPFAGLLDDGAPHTIAINVLNDGSYFAANAALLVYEDHGSARLTGGLLQNQTSASPTLNVAEGVTFDTQGNASGPINTNATHMVYLDGYVDTSHGRIETQVAQEIRFTNDQSVTSTATTFVQNIRQNTSISSVVTRTGQDGGAPSVVADQMMWPLTMDYAFAQNSDGTWSQKTSVQQGKVLNHAVHGPRSSFSSRLSNTVTAADTLTFTPNFTSYAPSNGRSSQHYRYTDSTGTCYDKTITSVDYVLAGDTLGC